MGKGNNDFMTEHGLSGHYNICTYFHTRYGRVSHLHMTLKVRLADQHVYDLLLVDLVDYSLDRA